MHYGLDEDQELFRREVAAFAAKELAPHYQSDDRAARMRPELPRQLAGVGLTGLRIPERFGGQAADAVTTGLAAEEVSKADVNACYLLLVAALNSDILVGNASEEQLARWLPSIADGSTVSALVLTEPGHGSDAANLALRAVPDGAGWRLVGEKTSISTGMVADTGVVFARTGGPGARGVSAFYVDLHDGRVARTPLDDHGGRAIGRASLHFDGVPVSRDELVGAEGAGFVSVMQGFDYSRAVIGLMCVGVAEAALEDALEYARTREAFGRPIGTHQGVAFPLVEQATRLAAARHLCYEALWRKDQGLEHSVAANMAKWFAPKTAGEVVHQALLTFGHAGWGTDSPLGQRLRDVMAFEIADGTAQVAKLVVARHLLGRGFAP
ncbi:acyl-CoA dehydrogenase family protein [Pseudonocardia sp. WMMC193]|uniref:acyl-CoA dehydrogenase family protein n=1 Tax=Pseudonocardia sp. WMMC193 TaxID=2911965 RepID=UPI001F1E5A1F|nr:acyl-CoA dehydrogenase family protein [Pseudonocardia sp. WMMC193]MCF7550757.1 acyl-CoA dehydrogenase family protein [Pseudonocardia sp. WMMC193]